MAGYRERFVAESNMIEGINRAPTQKELAEFSRFIALPKVTIEELVRFVKVYQPSARLRDEVGLDVRIGAYYPPPGGPEIRDQLRALLDSQDGCYSKHIAYEALHPFTDGNGRSGRMLWAWQAGVSSLSFLHRFYYQTLANTNR